MENDTLKNENNGGAPAGTVKGPLDGGAGEGNVPQNTNGGAQAGNVPQTTSNQGQSTPASGQKKEDEPKMVQVPADKLDKILEKLENQDKEIAILREAADKARLNRADIAHSTDGKLTKHVQLYILNGKYVVGWKTIIDDVYTDEKGVIHEDQRVAYYLDGDKEPVEMNLVRFARTRKLEKVEVVGENKDSDGKITYKVITKDGRELSVDVTFVN